MNNFCFGFVCGAILKNSVINVSTSVIKGSISVFHLLNKKKIVKTNDLINELTIVIKIKNGHDCSYNKHLFNDKSVIRINMGKDIVKILNGNKNFELNIEKICNLCNISFSNFEKIGTVYLYIGYTIDQEKYTNVYLPPDLIKCGDFFNTQDSVLKSNFSNMICASVNYANDKNEYITKYLKQFFNNQSTVTSEMLLMNYPNININLLNCKIIVIKLGGLIETFSINQKLN